jgi:D-3-phosphoglycerate dehydrogenase
MKILCTIGKEYAPEAKKILESLGAVDYATPTQDQLEKMIHTYTACVVQLGLRFDETVFTKAPHLRVIATATTSADHIDPRAAKKHGVTILSLKGATSFLKTIPSTAEHTWGLLLALLRHIVPAADAVRSGRWESPKFRGNELQGKTLGIIGVGRLGTMVARYGKAFGMNVIGFDERTIPKSVCRQVTLDQLLKISDIVSIHIHLSEETEGMIGAKELSRMKPSAVIINTARGKIVDEDALLQALKSNRVAGYAADVLANEVRFGTHCAQDPLVRYAKTHGNVLLSPHIGGRTVEARTATDVFTAKSIAQWIHKHR